MVPKPYVTAHSQFRGFRAVLFRMVPKHGRWRVSLSCRFRAVLFRMVPKRWVVIDTNKSSFRAVLFRMVPKLFKSMI